MEKEREAASFYIVTNPDFSFNEEEVTSDTRRTDHQYKYIWSQGQEWDLRGQTNAIFFR